VPPETALSAYQSANDSVAVDDVPSV
jgi:hypothetical protein